MRSVCSVACVAGVRKGRGRELGGETAREGGGRREEGGGEPFLSPSRAQIPPSPSPFNACHAGYVFRKQRTLPMLTAKTHRNLSTD